MLNVAINILKEEQVQILNKLKEAEGLVIYQKERLESEQEKQTKIVKELTDISKAINFLMDKEEQKNVK